MERRMARCEALQQQHAVQAARREAALEARVDHLEHRAAQLIAELRALHQALRTQLVHAREGTYAAASPLYVTHSWHNG